uniref:Uncharacterized protein n=1 Tax=Microbotryum lychnidis-dioicae TaxID=288795 RepID=M1GMT3_9BASI|nr:hypothetical protein H911_mgp27 [Microbotryum lychnidis-dioicae]YP_007475391.1 hypothetical protein H911_mgp13 [Microbotryum lychnidis-dioicae]AGE14591.1 hypothetical protein [Microbotryum lychnidis-dioicae]AGE14605.1 hypothetical protein [Microbotryum lychnidis-dioicae]
MKRLYKKGESKAEGFRMDQLSKEIVQRLEWYREDYEYLAKELVNSGKISKYLLRKRPSMIKRDVSEISDRVLGVTDKDIIKSRYDILDKLYNITCKFDPSIKSQAQLSFTSPLTELIERVLNVYEDRELAQSKLESELVKYNENYFKMLLELDNNSAQKVSILAKEYQGLVRSISLDTEKVYEHDNYRRMVEQLHSKSIRENRLARSGLLVMMLNIEWVSSIVIMECISAINKSLEGEVSTTIVAGNIKERFIRRIKILNNKYGTDNFVPPKLFRDGKLYNDFTMYDGLHQLSLMDDTEFIGVSSTLVFTLANNSKKLFNTRLIKKDGHSIPFY